MGYAGGNWGLPKSKPKRASRSDAPHCSAPVHCQCSCGRFHKIKRDPWECGSWHIDCQCGKRLKMRVLVDTVPNARLHAEAVADSVQDDVGNEAP